MKRIFASVLACIMTFAIPCFGISLADITFDGIDDVYYESEYPDAQFYEGYLPNEHLFYAAKSVSTYINNNAGKLPNYTNIDGNKIYMPEFFGILAQFVLITENNENIYVLRNSIIENSEEYEQLTPGTLTKEEYITLAKDAIEYINRKGEAPGYIRTSIGALSFGTMISVFANIVNSYGNDGVLLESVSVEEWGSELPIPPEESAEEFSLESILSSANSVNLYITNNEALPTYTKIDNVDVYMPEFIGILARVIVESDSDILEDVVERNDAYYSENSYEELSGSILVREEYVKAAQAVVNHIENSQSASAPGFVTTQIGTLSNETLLRIFSYICTALKTSGTLPESIIVEKWYAEFPTPPAATESPEYQYLNFVGILKGARRVMDAIETAQTVPNYVTLDVDTRVYKGTMLRLFAATVSNINRGKASDMPLQEIATPNSVVSETITECTFTRSEYTVIAKRIANVIYANDAVPTYITTGNGTMNYYNMIYMFARILDYYLANGFLPDEISVSPWGTYEF